MRLFALVCVAAFGLAGLAPRSAHADCLQDISRLMSRDVERLLSKYHRITRRLQREGPNARLRAEECRLARLLEPQLAGQIEALKQSRCRRDPAAAAMVSDIMRGHEADLDLIRQVRTRPECR
jgi:hypothetical protein